MRKKFIVTLSLVSILFLNLPPFSIAQQSNVKKIEITPNNGEYEVDQQVAFTVVGKDESGKVVATKAMFWFANPSDVAGADKDGNVTFFNSGEVTIGAVVGGQVGFAKVRAKAARVSKIEIATLKTPLAVGNTVQL